MEETLSKLVEQAFCPCCDRPIYFSVNQTTEVVCRSCQIHYQIQYYEFVKQGLTLLESEEAQQILQKLTYDNRKEQFYYWRCQDLSQQQKYIVLCPATGIFAFQSMINLSELEYIRGDRIAIFCRSG
ncbi:MAG: hypothetical protein HC784_07885 [Hydrococcus sp. CSU_1_8]|nr:hypothetical protein [Hydrococcus sp. CSU_1_8]